MLTIQRYKAMHLYITGTEKFTMSRNLHRSKANIAVCTVQEAEHFVKTRSCVTASLQDRHYLGFKLSTPSA